MSSHDAAQRLLRSAVGLADERRHWPLALQDLPHDLETSSLTVPFSLPLLADASRGLQQHRRRLLIGLNGPVGAGKSSLARQLLQLAPRFGLRLAVASIDDLYLPLPERRRQLAGNPFGVSRVPPGSHDLPLLAEAIDHWRHGNPLRLPRFNKSLADGEGERDGWSEHDADVLVLEGWLIGCRALPESSLETAIQAWASSQAGAPSQAGTPCQGASDASDADRTAQTWLTPTAPERAWMPRWNSNLVAYEALWDQLDGLWLLRPTAWTLPRRWRAQAEARQRRGGGGWLKAAELEALVRASLLSLPPQLYQDPLLTTDQVAVDQILKPDQASLERQPTQGADAVEREAASTNVVTPEDPAEAEEPVDAQDVREAREPVEAQADGTVQQQKTSTTRAVALLDGQRRCRWSGLTTDWPFHRSTNAQLSSESASSATG